MGWLSGWSKRLEITISNANVDSDLTHFPMLLELGISVGTGNTDVSCVFDELTQDANRKKIAVTKSDGETQLYIEIEKWDDANEKAILWVSKADWVVASAATTKIYLYYDVDHADNATYIGDVGSRTEVWDSSYEAVWHMNEASDAILKDSTGVNDSSANTLDAITGKIAGGMNGDGSEYATIPNDSSIERGAVGDNFTVETWFRTSGVGANKVLIHKRKLTSNYAYWDLRIKNDNKADFRLYDGTNAPVVITAGTVTDGNWHYLVGVRDVSADQIGIHIDGGARVNATDTTTATCATTDILNIGRYWSGSAYTYFHNGDLDEVRISSIDRSAAWVKACYYAQDDNVASWGSEQERHFGECSILSISSLSLDGDLIASGVVSISIVASLEAKPPMLYQGECIISTVPSLTALATCIFQGECIISTVPSLTALATCIFQGDCLMQVVASLVAEGVRVRGGVVSIEVVSSLAVEALSYVAQSLGYTGTLTAGDVLEIDIDNMTVELNGSNVRENLTGVFPLLYTETNELRWKDEGASRDLDLEVKHKPRW